MTRLDPRQFGRSPPQRTQWQARARRDAAWLLIIGTICGGAGIGLTFAEGVSPVLPIAFVTVGFGCFALALVAASES